MDGIDGKIDWPLRPDGSLPLSELYLGDYQVVDVAKPYAEDSYLEIEQMLLQGHPHATCGGRSLNGDAVDTNLTFVVTGRNGPRISDGVDQVTVRASDSFPYLAPPLARQNLALRQTPRAGALVRRSGEAARLDDPADALPDVLDRPHLCRSTGQLRYFENTTCKPRSRPVECTT